METLDLLAVLGLLAGGGLFTEIVRGLFARRTSAASITNQLYTVWESELERLTAQTGRQVDEINLLHEQIKELKTLINQFQALLGAFEAEIITLGGDPARIRHAVSRRLHLSTDDVAGSAF